MTREEKSTFSPQGWVWGPPPLMVMMMMMTRRRRAPYGIDKPKKEATWDIDNHSSNSAKEKQKDFIQTYTKLRRLSLSQL